MSEFKRLQLPEFNKGQMLEGIFKYQTHLMDEYKIRGMLPSVCDIQSREGQAFLKKTIYLVTEELIEAKEMYDAGMKEYLENGNKNLSVLIDYLDKFFDELGDTLHFMVELMIYSGIDHDDILNYYEQLCKERNLMPLLTTDGFTTSFNYGMQTNNFDDQVRIQTYFSMAVPGKKIKIGEEIHMFMRQDLLEIIGALHLAGHKLKKRDWSVKENELTPMQIYHFKLMDAWLYFFKMAQLTGMDAVSMYTYYEKMTFKNQDRLLTNY